MFQSVRSAWKQELMEVALRGAPSQIFGSMRERDHRRGDILAVSSPRDCKSRDFRYMSEEARDKLYS
jgi:hypothetical protein